MALFYGWPLLLFLIGALILPLPFVSTDIFRTMCLPDYVANRSRCEFGAGRPLNRFHARAFIRENCPLAAVEINRLAIKSFDDFSPVDNGGVVHN